MKSLLALLLILLVKLSFAQKITLEGRVLDAVNSDPIIGATVSLMEAADSMVITGEVTDIDGKFLIKDISQKSYLLEISYLGYQKLYKSISSESDVDFGIINLYEASEVLDEIVVEAEVVTGSQRGDTVSYNAAAFTTLDDATSGDLIAKMPGIIIQDGQVQAEGEAVQKILVDGKEFFSGDVNTALQSLPAEIIKNIEIFDQKSEKAQLTGFDDGNEVKTINIVTKANKKVGQFGKMTAGYGTDDKYQLGGSVNFFNGDQRWTVNGLSNNINLTDYSADPNSQGESRTQDGIINTNNAGLQYSNTFFKVVEVSGNYAFSSRSNEASGFVFRDYILPSQANQVYEENNFSERNDMDHRLNMRIEYKINERNKLIFLPRVDIKNDINLNRFSGTTFVSDDPLNSTTNNSNANNDDNDFRANLYFSHAFLKKGRTFTLSANTESHVNNDFAQRKAQNIFFYENFSESELLDQEIYRLRTGVDYEFGGSYTEPIGEYSQIELEYEYRNRKNDSEQLNYDIIDGFTERLDTSLSNVFTNGYITNEAELGYQFKKDKISLQLELEYQRADLDNAQVFPHSSELARGFNSWLPTLRLNYKPTQSKSIEFNYYTWTREPRIDQLQEVVDNSNPLRLRVGNPFLDQEYNNRVRARFRSRNTAKERSFYLGMDASLVSNAITYTTFIADEAFAVNDQITLSQGGQLIKPQNVDGRWSIRSFASYGFPITALKSNFNAWTGAGYRQLPGVINNERTTTGSTDIRLGLNLSSNISDRVDFNISTRSNYSIVNNSLRPELSNNFFRHSSQLNFKAIVWKGITFRTDLRHQFFTGLSADVDNSYFLVNGSIGTKMLKNDRGELSLSVYDLLAQNNNVRRNVSEVYIEDTQRTVLQRYLMLSFTYNLRHFNTGTSIDDFDMGEGQGGTRRGRRG